MARQLASRQGAEATVFIPVPGVTSTKYARPVPSGAVATVKSVTGEHRNARQMDATVPAGPSERKSRSPSEVRVT